MPKRVRQDPDHAVPVRVEVVPRRGLNRQEAARYVGVGAAKFDELVREGQMPPPFWIGSRRIWDMRKLDAAFDLLSGSKEELDGPPPKTMAQAIAEFDQQLEEHAIRKAARGPLSALARPSSDYPGHPNVYTADTLAERWTCSGNHVRNLVREGRLQAIERMGKMIRITPAAVIAFEEANATGLAR